MPVWNGIVGQAFDAEMFDAYCNGLHWTTWRPSFVVLHNTAVPTLAQRPAGFTAQHMTALEGFYRDTQGWSAGPHLFVDDHHVWVFTPLTVSGIHSPSWNALALGVEMLGNYETEVFDGGRGLAVRRNAIAAIATLSAVLGIDPATMRLHREDPKTTHACPGKNVSKPDFIADVRRVMTDRHGGEHVIA